MENENYDYTILYNFIQVHIYSLVMSYEYVQADEVAIELSRYIYNKIIIIDVIYTLYQAYINNLY